jgi:hypothetical protein
LSSYNELYGLVQAGWRTVTLSVQHTPPATPTAPAPMPQNAPVTPSGIRYFSLNPGPAVRAAFRNVPLTLADGDALGDTTLGIALRPSVQFRDTLGATTNIWDGVIRAEATGETIIMDMQQRDSLYVEQPPRKLDKKGIN